MLMGAIRAGIVALCVVGGTAAGFAACGAGHGPPRGQLVIPGDPDLSAGFGQDRAAARQAYTVLTVPLCVKKAPVRIQSIKLSRARGIRLVDWGWLERLHDSVGGQPGLARKLHQGFTQRPVDVRCGSSRHADLYLSVERTGSRSGTFRGYTINYPGGSIQAPFSIALCPAQCTNADLGVS
jgi:hypothetical protein